MAQRSWSVLQFKDWLALSSNAYYISEMETPLPVGAHHTNIRSLYHGYEGGAMDFGHVPKFRRP